MSEKNKDSGLDIDATIMETTHKLERFYHENKKNITNIDSNSNLNPSSR